MMRREDTKKKETPKGCLALFGLPFLAAGLFFLWLGGLSPIVGYLRAGSWAEVPAVVVASEVRESRGESTSYAAVIRYRYDYAGRTYESDKLLPGTASFSGDLQTANARVARYPVGAAIVCRVNPEAPADCLLERTVPGVVAFVIPFSLVFVAVGGGLVLGGLGVFDGYAARRKAREEAEAATRSVFAKSASKTAGPPKALLRLMGLFFAGIGGAVAFFLGVQPAWTAHAAASWPEVPCVIEASSVGRHRGSKGGTTYSVDIRYRYEFAGRTHVSDRYDALGGSSSGYEDKAAAVAKHPEGATATCRVNPAAPDEALLSRELGWGVWFGGGLGGVFFVIGLALLFGRLGGGVKAVAPGAVANGIGSGPVLRPRHGVFALLLAPLILATVWNGILYACTRPLLTAFAQGRPDWPGLLFALPFAAIGALLSVWVAHSLLRCLQARLELRMFGAWRAGGTVELAWRRVGGLIPLREATLILDVREVVTEYSRGANRGSREQSRVEAVIHAQACGTIYGDSATDGSCSVELPAEVPPTISTGNAGVTWLLRVRLRDVLGLSYTGEYELEVLPAALASDALADLAGREFRAPESALLKPDGGAFVPGESITGAVVADDKLRTLRLGWQVRGGDAPADDHEVASVTVAPGQTRFAVSIPDAVPPSYSGVTLNIGWTLELCDGDRRLASCALTVSPSRMRHTATHAEPDPSLVPWWYPWVSKLRAKLDANRADR